MRSRRYPVIINKWATLLGTLRQGETLKRLFYMA